MYKNYFKVALRNLTNNKFYSALNITGLTVSLTVGMLILIWVNDELSFDSFNHKAGQIYRVNTSLGTGLSKGVYPVVPGAIAAFSLKEIPGVENAVRLDRNNDYSVITYQDKTLQGNTLIYTDAALFKMFDYKMRKGSAMNPFPTDHSVVITESTAKKYFGDADPMGKVLRGDNKDNFVVSGVLEDFPENSSLQADILFSTDLVKNADYGAGKSFWKSLDVDFGNYRWNTYLQIQPGLSAKSIADKLTQIAIKNEPNLKPVDIGSFHLQSLTQTHLYAPDGSASAMQTIKIFSLVVFLILFIGSINYTNFSTARAMLRSKEVSLRKIIGAARRQLIAQFVIETALFFLIALTLSFAVILFLMPSFNALADKRMHFDLLNSGLWKLIGITVMATLVTSSVYPALLLSSFKPIDALKGKISPGIGNAAFRKFLVVCQFVFSIGLIIGTLVINRQLKFIREKELGYDKSNVFSFEMRNMQDHYTAIRSELLKKPVLDVTSATQSIVDIGGATLDVDWDGKDPNASYFIHAAGIDQDFIPFFKLKFSAGAGFTGSKMDTANLILNETAVKEAGIKSPIGKRFRYAGINGTIIGVVKDFHFASLKQKIQPFVFYYQPENQRMFIKTTGRGAHDAIEAVEKIWKQYNPAFPMDYIFMDETYDKMYKSDQRTGWLFDIFAGVAIFISCIGLFGLATYTAETRIKEIGIRKVLGASAGNIIMMLSKDFIILVMLSVIIATPVAWWAMNKWLMDFAYRSPLQWWIFAVGGLGALAITLLTVSFQAIKAAIANPVSSLRSE